MRALVIGGGSGIGLGSAASPRGRRRDASRSPAARSASWKRRPTKLRTGFAGAEIGVSVCDVLIGDDVRRTVDVAAGDDGLDIAVTVPGGGPYSPVARLRRRRLRRRDPRQRAPAVSDDQVRGSAMVRSGGGSIVAISSTVAFFPMPFNAGYAAGKTAVDMLVAHRGRRARGHRAGQRGASRAHRHRHHERSRRATTPSASASSSNNRSNESAGPTTSRRRFATSPGRSRAGSRASASPSTAATRCAGSPISPTSPAGSSARTTSTPRCAASCLGEEPSLARPGQASWFTGVEGGPREGSGW